MLEHLKTYLNKDVLIELVNGAKIVGKIIDVNLKFIKLQTPEGAGTIPFSAVAVIGENVDRSISQENMEYIATMAPPHCGWRYFSQRLSRGQKCTFSYRPQTNQCGWRYSPQSQSCNYPGYRPGSCGTSLFY